MCTVFSTMKQARARVDSSIHHRPWSRPRYPPTVDDIIATPRKHRGIRRRQKLPDKEIHDCFGGSSSDEEVREVGGTRSGPATRIFRQPRTVGTNMCPQVVEESEKKATSSLVGLVAWRKRRRRSSVRRK